MEIKKPPQQQKNKNRRIEKKYGGGDGKTIQEYVRVTENRLESEC